MYCIQTKKMRDMNDPIINRDIISFILPFNFLLLFISLITINIGPISISSISITTNLFIVAILFTIKTIRSLSITRFQKRVLQLYILMFITQLIGLFNNLNTRSLISMIQVLLIYVFICYMSNIDYSKHNISVFNVCYTILSISAFVENIFFKGLIWNRYFESGNTIGGIFVFISCINIFFVLINKSPRRMLIFSGILILPLINTDSRTALGGAVIIAMLYILLTLLHVRKSSGILLFICTILLVISIVYIYPRLTMWDGYAELNSLSLKYFGKHIVNPREMIWMTTIDVVGDDWLLGLGTGLLNRDIMNYKGSSHNQYVQLYLQNGLIGILLLFSLFYALWKPLTKYLKDKAIRFCIACFVGVIIFNCFESTLIQNKLVSGIVQWQLICMGVSRSLYLDLKRL